MPKCWFLAPEAGWSCRHLRRPIRAGPSTESTRLPRCSSWPNGRLGHSHRARLYQGYIDDAPRGPFDAATCLLTLHFMAFEERRRTAVEIHRRLKPGAPYVIAHLSFPQAEGERALWLSRHAAFLIASGLDPDQAANARVAIDTRTNILTPEQDEAILREAGFSQVSLFYAAFSFRGWVAYA